jgi:hypothetical protein
LATTGDHFADTRSAHVTLSCSVSSGGGFGDVAAMCIANAADSMKGILSKDIIHWIIFGSKTEVNPNLSPEISADSEFSFEPTFKQPSSSSSNQPGLSDQLEIRLSKTVSQFGALSV